MPATELATPPLRGLARMKRGGEGDNKNNSTNSLISSSNSDDPNSELGVGLRPTSSGGLTKFTDRIRRRSVQEERRSSADGGNRLSALISKRRNRSKRPKSSEETVANGEGDSSLLGLPDNESEESLGQAGSGRSSLLTEDDSDHENRPVRPTISPHQSHLGYLTLSSPAINAQTTAAATKSITATQHNSGEAGTSVNSIPHIVEPSESDNRASSDTALPDKPVSDFPEAEQQGASTIAESSTQAPQAAAFEAAYSSFAPATESEGVVGKSLERPETPKAQGRPRVNTNPLPATPPNLVETPTTFVTPPTPTDPSAEFPRRAVKKSAGGRKRSDTASSSESIKSRRAQSAIAPSKLSQSIHPPLTPHVEETKTPGGTLVQPAAGAGFFSSFFSAAQKTANQWGSSINIGANQKGKQPGQPSEGEQGGEEVITGTESDATRSDKDRATQPAVETLGSGNLNFGHLGLADRTASMPSAGEPAQNGASLPEDASNRAEEEAAARAVSDAYEKPVASAMSQALGGGRPLSIASNDRLTLSGEQSPPRPGADLESLKRSGSVRSKLSGRRRKHRASSATTGTNTIAAGLVATASGFQNVAASGAGHRLTGFAVASSKRNKDFHALFRSVPEDDYLIEDYSAALQRDILLHGRLYVSEGHICFSSNILGWVTNLVISFDEVVSVEKKSTAVIFPNAIVISTLHARNTFASFVARDSTYELLIGIWKISHPNLKSSLNGVTLDDAGTGDKTEVAEPEGSVDGSDSGTEDEVYDEDADDDAGSFEDAGLAPSIAGSEAGDPSLSRKTSGVPLAPGAPQPNGVGAKPNIAIAKGLEGADAVVTGAAVSSDFPGPPTHEPSQCTDSAEHYANLLIDTTIPAPLGKVYSMVFGPASGAFMGKWLVEDQKSRELNLNDDKIGLDNEHKTMTFDYIKPLYGSIGPKQTKCITTYNLIAYDLEKAVSVDCSTQTPDVPSGSVFMTKTRYCLMWAPGNSTRFLSTSTVEWSGKSWLKGPIEKGAQDGQSEFAKALTSALRAAVTTKPPVKGVPRKGKRKGTKEVFDAEKANAQREVSIATEQQPTNWGVFEPIHGPLKPLISVLSPFMTSQVVIAVLFVMLWYSWFSPPARSVGLGLRYPGYTSPERLAAYEELWRREESNLWDWLEDRVGLDNIYVPSGDGARKDQQKVLAAKNMARNLADEKMSGRQMDDAIRVTEERLSALKEAVARKKGVS